MSRILSAALIALFCLLPLGAAAQSADGDPALAPLLEALKDDEARARLIDALEGTTAPAPPPVIETPVNLQGSARQLAVTMTDFANELKDRLDTLSWDVLGISRLPNALTPERLERIYAEVPPLLLTVLVTAIIYRLLRALARRIVSRPDPDTATFGRQVMAVLAQAVLRALGIFLAWAVGFGLATGFTPGDIDLVQALYLNGFVAVNVLLFALSLFVSYDQRDLTLSDLSPRAEAVIFRSIRWVVYIKGYGIITLVPITQAWTGFVLARSVRSVVVTIALVMALWAIRRIWIVLREEQNERAQRVQSDDDPDNISDLVANTTQSLWVRIWPFLALTYVFTAFWVALTKPNLMVEMLGRATLFSLAALALLIVSFRILGNAGELALKMPKAIHNSLPTFESRVNGFVPTCAVVAGISGVIGAIILLADGWAVQTVSAVLDPALLWRLVSAALILGSTLLLWALLSAWIDTRLQNDGPHASVSARSRTLLALLRNAITVALLLFGVINALSELGINIAPILAGAGVIGLAIGFGAQKLVQDIITGVFIQLENAINEGDVITVAGVTGTVETLTIRSVGIRDLAGTYHLIPFSAVDTVANFMRGYAYHVEVVGVAYDSNLDHVREAMEEAFAKVRNSALGFNIIGSLEMHGVVGLGESSVNLRARVKTRPGHQWAVGRAYTEAVKLALDARGVEIPFPHRELRLPPEMLDRLRGPRPDPLADEGTATP